jgi:hypothetical protein
MKTIIKQKQIIKPTNGWYGDVRPEQGSSLLIGTGNRMYKTFNSNDKQGARGSPR